jgi:hypothetical protein
LNIAVLVAQGKTVQARRVFDEAVRRFPRYHPLYLAMSRAYTGEDFERFAIESVSLSRQFEGQGMYARLYKEVDQPLQMAFDPQSPLPAWGRLRGAYDDLLRHYPSSLLIANAYASVACRSDDSQLYRQLREKADVSLDRDAFSVVPVEACDRRHGWSRVKP